MSSLFLTSFHPLISRNILMGDVLPRFARERRVVIFVPAHKADYFRERFAGPRVVIEGVPTELGRRDLLFRRLALALTPTRDLAIKKRVEFARDRRLFSYLASTIPALLCGRSRVCVRLLRALDRRTAKERTFTDFFERHRPDLIVSTDVQNEIDIALMREAKRRGIRAVGMVRSWDNLTSKGILRCIPDRLIVHNELIKAEAVRYSFVNPSVISMIGIPHYDRYARARALLGTPAARSAREAFFASLGFDRAKKLILYAPFGDRYIRDNQTDICILETLAEFDANILVRLPPTDTVNFAGFKTRNARVAFYESGAASGRGGKKVNEVSEADEEHLVQSLSAADVVVTGQSTIAVDAAAFDTPVVIAAFDHEPRPYWDSVVRYFDYEYYKKFRERSGLAMARSPDELRAFVSRFLENPELDSAVRERIVRDQVFLFDGRATERLADLILSAIHER